MMYENLGKAPILQVNGIRYLRLRHALELAHFENARGWTIREDGLRFHEVIEEGVVQFPVPLTMNRVADVAWDWLQTGKQLSPTNERIAGWLMMAHNYKRGGNVITVNHHLIDRNPK